MEEIDYYAAFGLEDPEGAREPESAEPVQTDTPAAGEEVPEVAEPEVTDEHTSSQEPETAPQEEATAEPAVQTAEVNAQFAAARRKAEAERDAAVAKAQKDAAENAQKLIDQAFAGLGMTDPYTGKAITTQAEFQAYQSRYDQERRKAMLERSGMEQAEFDQFVSTLPEVQAARQAKIQAEQAAQQAKEEQAKADFEDQIRQIGEMDPTIKTAADLGKMENYQAFYDKVKQGYAPVDAYKLVNFEKLTQKHTAAARQAAVTAVQSKSHLAPTTTRGAGAVTVPKDVAAMYRAFNPGATDAEIQAHYQKEMKKRG